MPKKPMPEGSRPKMIHVGNDAHPKHCMVSWLDDETGEVSKRYQVKTFEFCEHVRSLGPDVEVALETSSTGLFLARQLKSCGIAVVLVDSFKGRRLLEAVNNRKHNDKLDAAGLMLLLAKGQLEDIQVWVPDDPTVELRDLVRSREAVVRQVVALRNQVRKMLGRHGLHCPFTDLVGRGAREWFSQLGDQLPKVSKDALLLLYGALLDLNARVEEFNRLIEAQAAARPEIQLLMTIPGVGPILAAIIVAEIGNIERFERAANLRSYARLVPQEVQSGERMWRGKLVKHGNHLLCWAMIQVAAHFASCKKTKDSRLTKKYQKTVFKYGPNPGKVSLARNLLDIVRAMLRDGTPFDADLHLAPAAKGASPRTADSAR